MIEHFRHMAVMSASAEVLDTAYAPLPSSSRKRKGPMESQSVPVFLATWMMGPGVTVAKGRDTKPRQMRAVDMASL